MSTTMTTRTRTRLPHWGLRTLLSHPWFMDRIGTLHPRPPCISRFSQIWEPAYLTQNRSVSPEYSVGNSDRPLQLLRVSLFLLTAAQKTIKSFACLPDRHIVFVRITEVFFPLFDWSQRSVTGILTARLYCNRYVAVSWVYVDELFHF